MFVCAREDKNSALTRGLLVHSDGAYLKKKWLIVCYTEGNRIYQDYKLWMKYVKDIFDHSISQKHTNSDLFKSIYFVFN